MIAVPGIITSLLILAIILSGCSHTAPTTTSVIDHKTKSAEEELEASQYSVYDAVINKMYLEDDRIGLVVIEDQTTLGLSQEREWEKELEYAGKIMPERLRLLSADIFNNFRAKNQTSTPLQQLFNLRVKCILISKNELDEMFRQRNDRSDGWVTFFEKYPTSHGITYLSNVGFNREMNQALVLAGNQWGWKAGAGYYVVLTKENGVWNIENRLQWWAS